MMKKTAVLIYEGFCNFEISVALECIALKNREITVFAKSPDSIKSEDGLRVLPDKSIYEIDIDEYDSLLLPGAEDIRDVIEDEDILSFIRKFDGKVIGAISIAPILLLKSGLLSNKEFMAGVNKEDLLEEGFTETELCKMRDWNDCVKNPTKDGYVIDSNIITSVSFEFVKFSLAFCKMIGIDISPKSFGL